MAGATPPIKSKGSLREVAGVMVKNTLVARDIYGNPLVVYLQKSASEDLKGHRQDYLKDQARLVKHGVSSGVSIRVKRAFSEFKSEDNVQYVVKVKRRFLTEESKNDYDIFQREQSAFHDVFGIDTYIEQREHNHEDGRVEQITYFVSPLLGEKNLGQQEKFFRDSDRQLYTADSDSSRADRLELALKAALQIGALQANRYEVFDVKPDNFIVSKENDLQILDFTDPDATESYVPPEYESSKKTGYCKNSPILSLGLAFAPLFPAAGIEHRVTRNQRSRVKDNGPKDTDSRSMHDLIASMSQEDPVRRPDIRQVIEGLSTELARERATQVVSKISDTQAPQAALMPAVYALYEGVVDEKLRLRESNPDQAEKLRVIAIDLLNGMQNKKGQYLGTVFLNEIANRLEAVLPEAVSAAGAGGPAVGVGGDSTSLATRARNLVVTGNAKNLDLMIEARQQFQPLIAQLEREITRLGKVKHKRGEQATIDSLTALNNHALIIISAAPDQVTIERHLELFQGEYQRIALQHEHRRKGLCRIGNTRVHNNFLKFRDTQAGAIEEGQATLFYDATTGWDTPPSSPASSTTAGTPQS